MDPRTALDRVDLDELSQTLRDAGAKFAYLHGSAVSETTRPNSDVDVGAFFGGQDPASWSIPSSWSRTADPAV